MSSSLIWVSVRFRVRVRVMDMGVFGVGFGLGIGSHVHMNVLCFDLVRLKVTAGGGHRRPGTQGGSGRNIGG